MRKPDTTRLTFSAGFVLATAGIAICSYLVSQHYADRTLVCGPVGDCHYVQDSEYATLGELPIAVLGLVLYVTIAAVALAALRKQWLLNATAAFFSLALAGLLYSAYLTYLELFVLDAVCMWCVASAANFALLFAIAVIAVRALSQASALPSGPSQFRSQSAEFRRR